MKNQLPLELGVDLIRCPKCGHLSDNDGFDVSGSCGDNLFCTQCHCEFDPVTFVIHDLERGCAKCNPGPQEAT